MYKNLNILELRRVLDLMNQRKKKFLINLIIAVISITTLVVTNSLTSKKIVNGIIYGDKELIIQAIYLAITGITLVCFVSPVTSYLATRYGKETIFEIRTNLFSHVVQLPKQYFHDHSSGEILSRLTNDLNKFASIYEGELYVVLESFAIGSVSVIMTFILEWRLALVTLLLGCATFSINTLYAKPIRKISLKVQSLLGKSTQRFLDLIVGNRVIKLFNIDKIIVHKFAKENSNLVDEMILLNKKDAEKDGVNYLLNGAYYIGILGAGGFLVSLGLTDMGTVVAVLSLRLGAEDLFIKFGSCLANMQKSLAGVNRVLELIDESEESIYDQTYRYQKNEKNDRSFLVLDHVQFSYDGSKNVLNGIEMKVEKEQVVALVGYSGAGKSTIIKLLLRLYTPREGKIILHGITEGNATLENWRSQFAYVSQDTYLFDTTIEENIRYGNPNATKEEIIQAAKRANAHNFIQSFPQGYETKVGENSTKLSGGQRQRIAIARALIKNAPILLLDEATSALDSESENLVQDAIGQLMQGHTTIVIAHRLSTIQNADHIYVIDEGTVVDHGKHEDLLLKEGAYKHLYELQFQD